MPKKRGYPTFVIQANHELLIESRQSTKVTEGIEWSYSILLSQSRGKTYPSNKFKLLQNDPKNWYIIFA